MTISDDRSLSLTDQLIDRENVEEREWAQHTRPTRVDVSDAMEFWFANNYYNMYTSLCERDG